jgi:hypothetical protein
MQLSEPAATGWPHINGEAAILVAYVNNYDNKLEEITTARVTAYKKLCVGAIPSSNGAMTRAKLEKLKAFSIGLHEVAVFKATEATQCNFLKKAKGIGDPAAASSDSEDSSESDSESSFFVRFVCDCQENVRSGGTICACVLAVADAKFNTKNSHMNLAQLLEETAPTRRSVGRPRKADPGSCYGGGGSSSSGSGSGRHTPHYYYTTIINSGALFFHKWRVVVDFDGNKCVGTIVSYRDDYHEERKPYTSKTPFTRLWKVRFFGDEANEFEEYDARELAKHLSMAHDQGARGPAAETRMEQLTSIPTAATAVCAGAAAEHEASE